MKATSPFTSEDKFYNWQGYQCSYEYYPAVNPNNQDISLLLIHPIGVGLSGNFWYRFCQESRKQGLNYAIYNPDLIGCGKSEIPKVAYYPQDWAEQLHYFLQNIIQKPVIIVVQGALLPVAIALTQLQNQSNSNLIKGLILSGPPAWRIMGEPGSEKQQKLAWNLFFNSPIGNLFWLYARRRQFIESFSIRQLFAQAEDVDQNWLDLLETGAKNAQTRYAVYSFLAGFWRQNYTDIMAKISIPTLAVFGTTASSISRSGFSETPEQRCQLYEKGWKNCQSAMIPGRNVLPYESTSEFVKIVAKFINQIS
ncbi:MAG TPA: alpha/beta hydrolase [Candidatus Obscuribacterales bacterium]